MINKNKKKNFIVLFFKKLLTSLLGSDIFNAPSKLGKEEIMKKDEILEMSRKENKKKDLQEMELENKACVFIAIAIAIMSLVFYALEIAIKGTANYGWYSFICLYNAIMFGYKGIKLKRKVDIFAGIIWLLLTIASIYFYVDGLYATSTIR